MKPLVREKFGPQLIGRYCLHVKSCVEPPLKGRGDIVIMLLGHFGRQASSPTDFRIVMGYQEREKKRAYGRAWTAARRAEYLAKRGGHCERCPSSLHLEFHHRDRDLKVSHRIWSWSRVRIEAELLKCDLLCKTCHDEETAKERGYYQAPHGTLTSYKNYRCRCSACRAANAVVEHARRLRLRK